MTYSIVFQMLTRRYSCFLRPSQSRPLSPSEGVEISCQKCLEANGLGGNSVIKSGNATCFVVGGRFQCIPVTLVGSGEDQVEICVFLKVLLFTTYFYFAVHQAPLSGGHQMSGGAIHRHLHRGRKVATERIFVIGKDPSPFFERPSLENYSTN